MFPLSSIINDYQPTFIIIVVLIWCISHCFFRPQRLVVLIKRDAAEITIWLDGANLSEWVDAHQRMPVNKVVSTVVGFALWWYVVWPVMGLVMGRLGVVWGGRSSEHGASAGDGWSCFPLGRSQAVPGQLIASPPFVNHLTSTSKPTTKHTPNTVPIMGYVLSTIARINVPYTAVLIIFAPLLGRCIDEPLPPMPGITRHRTKDGTKIISIHVHEEEWRECLIEHLHLMVWGLLALVIRLVLDPWIDPWIGGYVHWVTTTVLGLWALYDLYDRYVGW
ncbi:hypothetical protein LTR17_016340 [Elasticomyces elasticus]|nr:hypothetical protein LTR17_016340 [Elasticomyces elasticus]